MKAARVSLKRAWQYALVANLALLLVILTSNVINMVYRGSITSATPISALIVLIFVAVAIVFTSVLHFHCWLLLHLAFRRATPGKAIGYLFIPFFNWYWVFPSFVYLAQGWSRAAQCEENKAKELRNVAIAIGVMFIPSITGLFVPILIICALIFYSEIVKIAVSSPTVEKAEAGRRD